MANLTISTSEECMHIYQIYHEGNYGPPEKDGINLDGFITYDQMAEIVDYIRNRRKEE